MGDVWRGELISVDRLGDDVRIELAARPPEKPAEADHVTDHLEH